VLVALDTRREQIVRAIPPHVPGVARVDMALDRRVGRLVVVGYFYNGPGMVNLLDSASGRLVHTLPLITGVWRPPVIDGATFAESGCHDHPFAATAHNKRTPTYKRIPTPLSAPWRPKP